MKQKALLVAFLLLLSLTLTACSTSSDGSASTENATADMSAPQSSVAPQEMKTEEFSLTQSSSQSLGGSIYNAENAKIIRTASLYLQTTEFDAAASALDRLVLQQGGYFERSSVSGGSYYNSTSNRHGYYTIRIPKDNFEPFLSSVSNVAHIVDRSVESQDVGESYYDAQLRLATLKTKHDRLLALLEQADLMEDVISLESALSDVEFEIQQHTSTLDRYDALIDFSTIKIELQEVTRVTQSSDQTAGLSIRLVDAFSKGWLSFCDGLSNLVVWIAYHFVGCILFAAGLIAASIVTKKKILSFKNKNRF